ncbi:MAG: hypothetical protein HY040_04135 [Planctomycetes bacterium]|nr:hypothetical protein [Planctomycetota bacterium]
MVRQPVRIALLLGAITAVVSPARADEPIQAGDKPAGDKQAQVRPTNPCTRTIQVTECVPETYKTKRTCYKVECKSETYDAWRCERVPEVRERVVCCTKRVPVNRVEVRKCCKTVTEWETRNVTKTCHKYVQETCMEKKLVRLGHWECREECRSNFLSGLFSRCGHGNDCCDPCANSCNNCCRTVTRKHWVCCPEYRECPRTVCKKVCYTECVPCKVAVCKKVWVEEKVNVCTYECVTEKRVEKYTVCVERKVPCKATRTVRVCVPYEEEVTCTRMVPRTVTREVPINDCCDPCCESRGLFSRLRGAFGGHGCCDRGCDHGCRHNHGGCCN